MIFEINFFLFSFAQSNIANYLCVYAKYYTNITNAQYGTLCMIFPALAFIAKPLCCSLADARGWHKQILVASLMTYGLAYGSLAVFPFLKNPHDHESDTIAWLILSGLIIIGFVALACCNCMIDTLASNYARKHNKSYSRMRIYGNVGYASGALLVMSVGQISWLPFRVFGCIILTLCVVIDVVIVLLWPYPEDFEMFHDGSTVEQRKLSIVGPKTMALMALGRPRGSVSKDMLERIKAGRSKSVGGLPRVTDHSTSITISTHRNLTDEGFKQEKAPTKEKEDEVKEYSNFQCQIILIKMIASEHKSFVRNIVLFTIFGFINAVISNFALDYFKGFVVKDDAEFEFISTLSMIVQMLLGEILINLVAYDMIRWFGTNANLSLALVSIGLRAYFYANMLPHLGPLSVIISESLQGPSMGLYWVLIVEIGSNYALMVPDYMPKLKERGIVRDSQHEAELSGCLRATMIGCMSSSSEGLGAMIGSFLGGLITSYYGYYSLWNVCAALAIGAGFVNLGWDLVRKLT